MGLSRSFVISAGLATWLTNRPHRAYEASALRSLFGTLKAERLIFGNPMRGIEGGRLTTPILASLTAEEVDAVAQAARQDPALRVVVALCGIDALAAHQSRTSVASSAGEHKTPMN
ncbi:hypothetical protein ACFU76_31710 [Streptomyces sp. NPDC057539]|uniref:hypothetical protein n=1 Tax=Streptomyces sp. NPDC057539 TaxID=3346159 RepID=UPI0036C0923D